MAFGVGGLSGGVQSDSSQLYGASPTSSLFGPAGQTINALFQQNEQNEITKLQNQMQIENMQTASSIRSAIQSALHTMANQATTLSQQFIGDEIAQVKKGVENSGKAV